MRPHRGMARWGDLELPGETPARQDPAHHPLPPQADPRPCQLPRGKCRTQAGRAGSAGKLEHAGSGWGAGNRAPVLPHSVEGGDNTSDLGGLSVTLTLRRRQLAGGQPARRLPVSPSSSRGVPQELQTDVGPGPPHQGPPRPGLRPQRGFCPSGPAAPRGAGQGPPERGRRGAWGVPGLFLPAAASTSPCPF